MRNDFIEENNAVKIFSTRRANDGMVNSFIIDADDLPKVK